MKVVPRSLDQPYLFQSVHVRTWTSLRTMRTLEALSLFLLLISSSAFLVHGSPAPESINITVSDDVNLTEISTTTLVTTASSTVAPPITTVSHDDKGKQRVAPNKAEEDPSSESDEKPKEKSAMLLMYEVEKNIRNLSLNAIEYVLGLGDDVFSFALADALGYLKGGQEDDNEPHRKVMDENKQALIKILKERKQALKPVVKVPPPTTKPVTSPPPSETPPPPNEYRIKYDIVKKMRKLTIEDIDHLMDTFSGLTLPFALGKQLGYEIERDAEVFQYLNARGEENLKGVLMKEKERKLAEPHPKPSQDNQPQSDGDDATELGSNRPPDGGGVKTTEEVNRGSKEREKAIGGGDHQQVAGGNSQGEVDLNNAQSSDDGGDLTKPPENGLINDENANGEVADNENMNTEEQSNTDKDVATDKIPPSLEDEGGGGEGEGTRGLEGKPKDGDTEQGNGHHENGAADSANPKGSDKKGGDPAKGENQNKKEEESHDTVEGEGEEVVIGRSGFSFGAWHFLSIFILVGVAVVVGYLCLHNRKKLREGVGTYINDSNKRRRRAREYKPLVST